MASEVETAVVRVAEGELRGRRVESRAGGSFWSFQGVPYARPPLGPLRFKDAQPAEPWQGVRDALKEGDSCTQYHYVLRDYVGSEDCLFLNVYTPQLPAPGLEPMPVMVYIHGGGFENGSGNADMLGADYLVAEDVVIVTINYRVGVLGFLYLGEASPGNAGLKDQVAALRWVQRNIAPFGGDPENVTIFGTSAGGVSVHMHMLSPMTKGLFKRAIAMSGAALNPWAVQTAPEESARRLASLLGCASDDPRDIVRFLRGVDHKELVRVAREEATPEKDKKRLFTFSFVPTPEKVVPDVQAFLPAPLEELVEKGTAHPEVSFMTGVAEKEGLCVSVLGNVLRRSEASQNIAETWEEAILLDMPLTQDESKRAQAVADLKKFFMDGKPLSDETTDGFTDMLSDVQFETAVQNGLRNLIKTTHSPAYQYLFSADDDLNFMKAVFKVQYKGACHGDDIGYIFASSFHEVPADSTAATLRKRFIRMLTNFAKTGDPTPAGDALLGVRWAPFAQGRRSFLQVGAELRCGRDLHAERVAFWDRFYAKYAP